MEDLSSSITFSSVPCRRIHFSHMYTYVCKCNGVKLYLKCLKRNSKLFFKVRILFTLKEFENVNFYPSQLGQKFFVHFVGELKKLKSPFEIN